MKLLRIANLRVVLTGAGALAALVGGAETATWGLSPLAEYGAAERIVATDANPGETTPTVGLIQDASPSAPGASSLDTTPAAYPVPPTPPATDESPDDPRADGEPVEATSPASDSMSGASARVGDSRSEGASGPSPETETSAPHDEVDGAAPTSVNAAGEGSRPD